MSIDKIIKNELINDGAIHLYLEGMFWKAYQRSAFLFVTNVVAFKIKKSKAKAIGIETVSLGFPKASLLNHFKQEQITVINEKELTINGYYFEEQSYDEWLNSIPFTIKESKNEEKVELKNKQTDVITQTVNSNAQRVIELLGAFRLEKSTPMDCMLFINKAKEILDGNI